MIRRAAVCGVLLFAVPVAHAVTPPRDGGPLPESFQATRSKDPTAYTPLRAWVIKAQRLREAQREWRVHNETALQPASFGQFAVAGTLRVPVLPGYFSDQLQGPVTQTQLQNTLFDNNPTGTIGQYYSEVSYGQFTVDGDVFGWKKLASTNAFYAGTSQGSDTLSHVGDMVKDLVQKNDATVDFGQYDNDGPDGVPNSGDDDGFVDLLCVLHSYRGGECGITDHIISHTWRYSAWPVSGGQPYTTNDARAGGGFIRVDDYTVAPAIACGSSLPTHTPIEIGVFCHEFGHGLGLPDLYDRDGTTNGIGHWGIMGSGSWNTPATPAHPEAWTRVELGWVTPVDIGWQPTPVNIPNVEQNPVVYRLPFTDERFRRSNACVIAGSYSLYCGLSQSEASARHYISPGTGGGYGPNWYETVERKFHYSGTGTVSLQYQYQYDTEPGYDFGYALIEVNGTETQLASYNGTSSGVANIPLTAYLAPLAGAGGDYTLKFRVITDLSFDDADGNSPSDCGALIIDNVSVQGGGVSYTSDFETYADGWFQDPAENPSSEYWLVENRQAIGKDANLHGTGLLVWHVDEEVLNAPFMQNDGTANGVRGLALEEADGLLNMNGTNFGNGGDPFPGTTGNTTFGSLTSPSSSDNTQRATQIEITSIGPSAATMSATLRAGDRGPVATAVTPPVIDNDRVAAPVEIAGSRFQAGATFRFVLSGGGTQSPASTADAQDIVASSLQWVDGALLRGTLNVYSKTAGLWDLVVTNPDGQTFTLANAITINYIVATRLRAAYADVVGDGVRLRYELEGRDPGEVVRLSRSEDPDFGWRVIAADLQPDAIDRYEYVDRGVEAGKVYYYLLESISTEGEVRELNRTSATVPARQLVLEQNHPNPFNPRTSIRFYLPARGPVELNVYDVRGALVRRLARGSFDAGSQTLVWDGTDDAGRPVASGIYVYRLTVDRHSLTRKMTLLK
ncbi:MAG TPA: M6 family metalloprotease domain-containing protein [Candidatus Krumholzibacteria bacterium]|nr:M6 family metalloprotease domain-containing protein [Candidatus Krumholzibacteria bacterium]